MTPKEKFKKTFSYATEEEVDNYFILLEALEETCHTK